MSDIENLKACYGLPMKPKLKSEEEERIAKLRENEKRKRKEKLYLSPWPRRTDLKGKNSEIQ